MSRKVVVGMSGGVDSSVAAWLLKEQGYDVIGVTMQIWQDEDTLVQEAEGGCCGLSAVDDARRVAMDLGIPYYVMNFKNEFRTQVMDYFAAEYMAGRTPNPCIACNRYVKWESLLRRSLSIGADYIATGHYARIEQLPNGRYAIKKSVTAAKDQTYALYNLTQEQLSHTLMPVGNYHKDEIIEEYTGKTMEPGNFVDLDGNVLGRHKGISHYTVGQRKGLNLAMGYPVFVVAIRPETNEVVLGNGQDVFTDVVRCNKLNWMALEGVGEEEISVNAKIRYSHKGAPCKIRRIGEDMVECRFEEPVRAATPGQAVVFYQDDYVAGGGTIL